jgi:DNA-directed RNA polymerase subunit RPC12/RpoP
MKRVSGISNNNRPVAGWKLQDENYLRKYDSAEAGPELQILTEEDWEDDDKEQREYFCAICKSKLDYLEGTETIWICSNCSQTYVVLWLRHLA